MTDVVDSATLCPVTRLPMSRSEEFTLATDVLAGYDDAPEDLLARGENRVLDCVMRNRKHIAEALAFFEQKDAIRASIAGLQDLPHQHQNYNQAIEDALALLDREVML